jgi:hypothetical protein
VGGQKAHGWTQAAIVAGAKDIGLSPAIGGVLERGESELVEVSVAWLGEGGASCIALFQSHAKQRIERPLLSLRLADTVAWLGLLSR